MTIKPDGAGAATTEDVEYRDNLGAVEAVPGTRTLVGYAAVFNCDAVIGDEFVERIAPGAFDTSLSSDIMALWAHDPSRVLGRTASRTLRLSVDAKGLRSEIDVPNTTTGNDLWELVERGDVAGMSFGFRVTSDVWDFGGKLPTRTIKSVKLYEVTATPIPAYTDTTLAKRSLDAARADVTSEVQKRAADAAAAKRRLAERRAKLDQAIRGLRQDAT